MRNIVILQWGPENLCHQDPREYIRIKSESFLDDGPMMPHFLPPTHCRVEKSDLEQFRVKYVLAKEGNLNKVIKNMRMCFGFPWAQSIGYVNCMENKCRVRSEHEHLVSELRQWGMSKSCDAIVWFDYEKIGAKNDSRSGQKSVPFDERHLLYYPPEAQNRGNYYVPKRAHIKPGGGKRMNAINNAAHNWYDDDDYFEDEEIWTKQRLMKKLLKQNVNFGRSFTGLNS